MTDKQKQLEGKILDCVDSILGKNGIGSKYGLHYQPEQHQYARSAALIFARGTDEMASMGLLEAATGTGKTIGYGVPLALLAALTGARVGISTYTLHLQRQIMEKDMPIILALVKEMTGVELKVARRIGIRNFVSYSRLLDVANDIPKTDTNQGEWLILEELLRFAKESTDKNGVSNGEIAQFIEETGINKLPFDLTPDQICLSSDCPENEKHAFNVHCAQSKEADIVVTSHAMTILHTRNTFSILDDVRPISTMVFDEADKFPDAALSILNQRFPIVRVRAILEKIAHPEFEKCSKSARALESEIHKVGANYPGALFVPNPTSHQELNKALFQFAKNLRSVVRFASSLKLNGQKELIGIDDVLKEHLANLVGYSERLTEMSSQFMNEGKNQSLAVNISFSPSRKFPTISVSPRSPGYALSKLWLPRKDELGQESLYLKACLMTSASLGDPGRKDIHDKFSRFMFDCGIFDKVRLKDEPQNSALRRQILNINYDLFQSFEPLMFGKMEFILADPRLPKPLMKNGETEIEDEEDEENYQTPHIANPIWLNYLCNAICYANNKFGGRTLVLTNSYNDTETVAAMLTTLPDDVRPKNIIAHYRSNKLGELIEQFKKYPDSILISAGAWEGISLVSESGKGMVDNLVISRLPYGGRDVIATKVFEDELRDKGNTTEQIKSIMHAVYEAAARRKLLQGLGRGIRSRLDFCRVFITDPRFPLVDSIRSKVEFGASTVCTKSSFHHCVPKRFLPALRNAKILRMDGTIF